MADYTKLSDTDIETLLKGYDLGTVTGVVPLSGGQANSSFLVTAARGEFTLCVCDEKTPEEIATLTRVLSYLETGKFPTTRVVPTAKGNKFLSHGGKPVYLKEFLQGEVVKGLDRSKLEQVGRTMAQLHEFAPPDGLPQAFPYGFGHFDQVLTAEISHPFKGWLQEKSNWLASELDLSMAKGFIHGDIFWDNLLFRAGKLVAVLDFEEASHYFFLYDLGMAVVGCCAAGGCFDEDKVNRLLQGYQTGRPMTADEKEQFVPFLVYAATAAAFWRFRQYNLRHPDPELADYYKELSSLADQAMDFKL